MLLRRRHCPIQLVNLDKLAVVVVSINDEFQMLTFTVLIGGSVYANR